MQGGVCPLAVECHCHGAMRFGFRVLKHLTRVLQHVPKVQTIAKISLHFESNRIILTIMAHFGLGYGSAGCLPGPTRDWGTVRRRPPAPARAPEPLAEAGLPVPLGVVPPPPGRLPVGRVVDLESTAFRRGVRSAVGFAG